MSIFKQLIRQLIETFFIAATFTLISACIMLRWDLVIADMFERYLSSDRIIQTVADPYVLRLLPRYERDCALTPGVACLHLAQIYETGAAGTVDKRRARKVMQRGCAALSGDACAFLARMYEQGVGGKPDQELADVHMIQACKLKVPEACVVMGRRLTHREGDERDVFIAFSMLASACEMGEVNGCIDAKALQANPETSRIIDEKIELIKLAMDAQ